MMKSFDLESVGKKMPYEAPSAEFFENFNDATLARIERERGVGMRIRRMLISIPAVAAVAAIVLTVALRAESSVDIFNDFDMSLDSYVENLSDDDLNSLLYDIELASEFYTNL